ncbi:hypothetical protein C8Q72DRAFT_786297 [Fomitopsis betulina]|nr:hypothetical protein C8Q72DRAFT_786297 [Fomitopsis betulina]
MRSCLDCQGHAATEVFDLTQLVWTQVTVFTCHWGPIPSWSLSAKCRGCHTRYYPTYYVQDKRTIRTHYMGLPHAVHVATHSYIEHSLCEKFRTSMVCAWVSATNNARIYNEEHGDVSSRFPSGWPTTGRMTCPMVWDAFFIHSLLEEYSEMHRHLVLDNNQHQATCLSNAIRRHKRNISAIGTGQEEWSHACDLCCVVEVQDNKASAVMDGISIGRPCCSVHDCKNPLSSQRARFCGTHKSMNDICCVVDCSTPSEKGFQTCHEPSHRALEHVGAEHHSAMFQLRKRLEQSERAQIEDALGNDAGEVAANEVVEVDKDGECDGKDEAGNLKPRAQFGRRRTHNEQLCAATCGIIVGRATMFGSEAPNGCRKHIDAVGDHHFDECVLPVDVFHMKSNHKGSDTYCGFFCNPARFPDLIQGGKWCFNSSATETTNTWLGGFQAIVREMREDRYDFFLDEMIKQRNRMFIADLRNCGARPYHIPHTALLD